MLGGHIFIQSEALNKNMGIAERCRTAIPFSYTEPINSALLTRVARTVHCAVRATRAAGAFSLSLLPNKVNAYGNDYGDQYNTNKDSGKVCGDKAKHGINSSMKKLSN